MDPIRTLIADDYVFFARTLKAHLEETGLAQVVGVAKSGMEAVSLAGRCRAELVITKIRLPGMDGMETSRRIRENRPHMKIILYTDDAPEIYAARSDFCAHACVLQDRLFDELPDLIQGLGFQGRPHGGRMPITTTEERR